MLELLSLLNVIHNERVQEARGAQLELRLHGAVGKHRLLDAGHLDVVAAGDFQELLNVLHLLWLSALLASILKKNDQAGHHAAHIPFCRSRIR